jgi:hypothetical protein
LLHIDKAVAGIYGALSPNIATSEKLAAFWSHVQIVLVPQVGHFFVFVEIHSEVSVNAVDGLISGTLPADTAVTSQ